MPGAIVEADESPYQACSREVEEELGLALLVDRLLCMEYQSRHGDKTESLQFIFYGAVLSPEAFAGISLQESELTEYRVVPEVEWSQMLNPLLSKRMQCKAPR